jgi:hypothetical protein
MSASVVLVILWVVEFSIENYSSNRFRFLATIGRCSLRTHPEDNPVLSQQVHWKHSGYDLRFAGVSIGPWQSSSQSSKLSSTTSNSPEIYKTVNLILKCTNTNLGENCTQYLPELYWCRILYRNFCMLPTEAQFFEFPSST